MGHPLLDRWSAFCAKIEERHAALIAEAGAGVAELSAVAPADPAPTLAAIQAVHLRLLALTRKVDETWSGQVGDALLAVSTAVRDEGLALREESEARMEEAWGRARARLEADVCRAMEPLVTAALATPVRCTQCAATLAALQSRDARRMTCPHCGAVNQVFPPPVVADWLLRAPHAYGEEAALDCRFALARYRRDVERVRAARGWPKEDAATVERSRQMEREAWESYARARGRVTAESEASLREFVASRLRG
jgi:hypothetical protein